MPEYSNSQLGKFEGMRYACKGVIDRLMLAPDGAFEIHDYKTGAGLPAQAELYRDRQLALYQIGVQKLWPEAREVRLVWHLVAFDMARSVRTPDANSTVLLTSRN